LGEVTEALRRAGREPERSLGPPPDASERPAPAPVRISRSREGDWRARAVLTDPPGVQLEQFRRFALRVRRSLEERGARSVLITSALQGEGKTMVACNLALTLASMAAGSRIALLDLDLHRPSVAAGLGIDPGPGITPVLEGQRRLRTARIQTDLPALDVFPAARAVPGCHELLARPTLAAVLQELSGEYATVVCDGPPALLASDLELVAPHFGGCVLVARAGVTRRFPFREAIRMLPRENLVGTFLNYASLPRHARNYAHYAADHAAEDAEIEDEEEFWDELDDTGTGRNGRYDD